ncbi:MAG: hypothetical protein KC978_18415, partial [Candidatus Omnitrophica bacterium]|nr:hypothetical protein [Candidatus Omnitrophota bacterium]
IGRNLMGATNLIDSYQPYGSESVSTDDSLSSHGIDPVAGWFASIHFDETDPAVSTHRVRHRINSVATQRAVC